VCRTPFSSALAGPIAIAAVNATTDPRNVVASQAILLIVSLVEATHGADLHQVYTKSRQNARFQD
jgi:hypothetical protein